MSLLAISHAKASAEDTIASYQSALYCIEPSGRASVVLRIGERSDGLAALYSEHRELAAFSCGFVTACNPLGVALRNADNAVATAALCVDVQAMGLPMLPGVCRDGDPASGWFGEECVAVLGISRNATCTLGQRYRQHAVVWAGSDAVPELLFIR